MRLRYTVAKYYLNIVGSKFDVSDPQEARKHFEKGAIKRLKPRVRTIANHTLGDTALRVYGGSNSSVIIFFHGGGWVAGSINTHDDFCRYLSKYTRSNIVSVDYALSPEHKYPAAIQQSDKIIDWAINKYPDRSIFLAGDSAGGNIALHLAATSKQSAKLAGLVMFYPALDPSLNTKSMRELGHGHFVTVDLGKDLWKLYLGKERYVWPLSDKTLIKLPPTLVIEGDKDMFYSESLAVVERLQALGKPAEFISYPYMLHGFMQFPRFFSYKVKALRKCAEFITKNSEAHTKN